jgi:hypothetical protein
MVDLERLERSPVGAASTTLPILIAMTALILVGGQAHAAGPPNLRDLLFGRHGDESSRGADAPVVARYEGENGAAFILDRTRAAAALLQFDGDPEIWALKATPGPHGDIIYRNDLGQPMLRSNRLGGVTLFTPGRPSGMPAAFVGEGTPPRPPPVLGPDALFQLQLHMSLRATRAAQHLVGFDALDKPDDVITPSSEVVFAEAFIITAQAFVRVAETTKPGQSAISRIRQVHFVIGSTPDATVNGPTMRVTLAPDRGVAGRPSSGRLIAVLSRR